MKYSIVVLSIFSLFASSTVYAYAPVAKPRYNHPNPVWQTIRMVKYTPSETKKLAKQIEKARTQMNFLAVASQWAWKFPAIPAITSTLAYLLSGHQQTVINAAKKNRGVTFIYQKNLNPISHNNLTRLVIR